MRTKKEIVAQIVIDIVLITVTIGMGIFLILTW